MQIARQYDVILLSKDDITKYSNVFTIPVFNSPQEHWVVKKMYKHPTLGSKIWNCKMRKGMDITREKKYFETSPTSIAVVEGKHMMKFGYSTKKLKYWLNEKNKTRFNLLGKDFLCWRDVSMKKDRRMMKVMVVRSEEMIAVTSSTYVIYELPAPFEYVCAIMNSIPFEFRIRQIVSNRHVSIYIAKDMPVPLFDDKNDLHRYIVKKAIAFKPKANVWADNKVTKKVPHADQVGELEHRRELAEFDALSALIYNLNLGEFKITLNAHIRVDEEYKTEAIKQYYKLVEQFELGDECQLYTSDVQFLSAEIEQKY